MKVTKPLPLLWPEDQRVRDTSVKWVVRDLLRQGAVGSVYGLPGTFKSFIMVDAAVCIANGGKEFLGSPIEINGPVVIIAADDGADTAIDRLRMAAQFRLGHTQYCNIAIIDRVPFSLQSPWAQNQLETAIIACGSRFGVPPVLTIIDTAAMAGAPTEDFGHTYPEKLGWLKRVASETGCTFVLVDHEAQPSIGRPQLDPRTGVWGSMMKAGFFECAWHVSRTGQDGEPRAEVEVSDKRSPKRPKVKLEFGHDEDTYSMEWSEAPNGVTVQDSILSALAESGAMSISQLEGATGYGRDRVRRTVGKLGHRIQEVRPAKGQIPALYDLKDGANPMG